MPLQVQSNLDKSSSDRKELKKISEQILRCVREKNRDKLISVIIAHKWQKKNA
jgi:hypothetical protein